MTPLSRRNVKQYLNKFRSGYWPSGPGLSPGKPCPFDTPVTGKNDTFAPAVCTGYNQEFALDEERLICSYCSVPVFIVNELGCRHMLPMDIKDGATRYFCRRKNTMIPDPNMCSYGECEVYNF